MAPSPFLEHLWTNHFQLMVTVCYGFLGLTNNFAYVIMLSAAHDILAPHNKTNNDSTSATLFKNEGDFDFAAAAVSNKSNKYHCSDLSTGAILLADILPGIVIKLLAPFFVHHIKYSLRVVLVVIVNAASFLLVALVPTEYKWLIFVGVMCASLSASFGEITFLSLSTLYDRRLSLTGWGSGTGGAGLIGSLGYAGLTQAGLAPRTTILIMLFIPGLMVLSYWLLPSLEFVNQRQYTTLVDPDRRSIQEDASSVDSSIQILPDTTSSGPASRAGDGVFMSRMRLLRPLAKYMIPLFLVYYAEYFINQGLFELMSFEKAFIKEPKDQYRWYNVAYQLAVFISRTSIRFVHIKFLPIFPALQLLNVAVALTQIFFGYMGSIWLVFALIFWEGLLGGGCYVNAFNQLSIEIPKKNREMSIAIASIADSIGIALAGFTAIPVHNAICNYGDR